MFRVRPGGVLEHPVRLLRMLRSIRPAVNRN